MRVLLPEFFNKRNCSRESSGQAGRSRHEAFGVIPRRVASEFFPGRIVEFFSKFISPTLISFSLKSFNFFGDDQGTPLIHQCALVIAFFLQTSIFNTFFLTSFYAFCVSFLFFFFFPALSRAAHIPCWGTGKCICACRWDVSVFGSQQQHRKCHHPDKES